MSHEYDLYKAILYKEYKKIQEISKNIDEESVCKGISYGVTLVDIDVVICLIDHPKVNINYVDSCNKNYIMMLIDSCIDERVGVPILNLLLKRNINVEYKYDKDETILMRLVKMGMIECIKLIISYYDNINQIDYKNNTSLDYGIICQNCEVIEVLVKYGGKIGEYNKYKQLTNNILEKILKTDQDFDISELNIDQVNIELLIKYNIKIKSSVYYMAVKSNNIGLIYKLVYEKVEMPEDIFYQGVKNRDICVDTLECLYKLYANVNYMYQGDHNSVYYHYMNNKMNENYNELLMYMMKVGCDLSKMIKYVMIHEKYDDLSKVINYVKDMREIIIPSSVEMNNLVLQNIKNINLEIACQMIDVYGLMGMNKIISSEYIVTVDIINHIIKRGNVEYLRSVLYWFKGVIDINTMGKDNIIPIDLAIEMKDIDMIRVILLFDVTLSKQNVMDILKFDQVEYVRLLIDNKVEIDPDYIFENSKNVEIIKMMWGKERDLLYS